jgi:hypothetical protein
MSYTPENSSIKTDAEFEAAVAAASSAEEIKSLMHDRAIQQGIVVPDRYSPDVLIPTPAANASVPSAYAHRVVIDGKAHIISAETPEALSAAVDDFYRQQFSRPAAARTEQPRDASTGRFTPAEQGRADESAFAKAELELKFKRGEISTDEYLTQSGAIERHLADIGVDVNALRATTEQMQNAEFQQSWEAATTEFLQSEAGAGWPGGERNKEIIGKILVDMKKVDEPSAENLALAVEYAKENDLLVENAEAKNLEAIGEATTFEEIVEAARRSVGR